LHDAGHYREVVRDHAEVLEEIGPPSPFIDRELPVEIDQVCAERLPHAIDLGLEDHRGPAVDADE